MAEYANGKIIAIFQYHCLAGVSIIVVSYFIFSAH